MTHEKAKKTAHLYLNNRTTPFQPLFSSKVRRCDLPPHSRGKKELSPDPITPAI
jgi:hypothetical protein